MKLPTPSTLLVAAICAFGLTPVAPAAVITYSPTNIPFDSNGSFLDNSGTTIIAANPAASNTVSGNYTLNGINLTNSASLSTASNMNPLIFTGGGTTMTITGIGGNTIAMNTIPAGNGTYSNSNVAGVLGGGLDSPASSTAAAVGIKLSLTGLTIGQQYSLQTLHWQSSNASDRQMWMQNGSIATPGNNQSSAFGPVDDPLVLDSKAAFMTATWTADATTQDFNFVNTNNGVFSRAVLNMAVLQAVPEPGTLTLLAGSLAALVVFRRYFYKARRN